MDLKKVEIIVSNQGHVVYSFDCFSWIALIHWQSDEKLDSVVSFAELNLVGRDWSCIVCTQLDEFFDLNMSGNLLPEVIGSVTSSFFCGETLWCHKAKGVSGGDCLCDWYCFKKYDMFSFPLSLAASATYVWCPLTLSVFNMSRRWMCLLCLLRFLIFMTSNFNSGRLLS